MFVTSVLHYLDYLHIGSSVLNLLLWLRFLITPTSHLAPYMLRVTNSLADTHTGSSDGRSSLPPQTISP